MAIRIRRGNLIDFDKDKLVQGELAIVLDAGELHFCYGAGNTKRLQTREDLQQMLDMSETSFSALIQLIADLENDPNELTNILSNISALQNDKADKSYVDTSLELKVDKTSITNQVVNDQNKINSAAAIFGLSNQVDTINNNLAYQAGVFTPELRFGEANVGMVYTRNAGKYMKIGSLCHFEIDILLSNKGTSTGTAQIFGLPFSASSADPAISFAVGLSGRIAFSGNYLCAVAGKGSNRLTLASMVSGNTQSNLNDTNFENTSFLRISGEYLIA